VFEFIEREKAALGVQAICRTLGVSASGYYAWKSRPPCRRRREDERLKTLIAEIHRFSRGTYGAPRVQAELRFAHGLRCSKKRVARLMRLLGVQGVHRRRGKRTTVRSPEAAPAPDLVQRNFQATGPGQLLVADITYVPTWAGFLFLAVVVDAFSRVVAGWSMANHLRTELVLNALQMALRRRRIAPGAVHHSDQGSQYTSIAFGQHLREAGLLASMGSRGDAYDNALCESFFASLECELLDRSSFLNRSAARVGVFDYIECWYNPHRRHSALGMLSPLEFEWHWRQAQLPEQLSPRPGPPAKEDSRGGDTWTYDSNR
jgi:putative transposase